MTTNNTNEMNTRYLKVAAHDAFEIVNQFPESSLLWKRLAQALKLLNAEDKAELVDLVTGSEYPSRNVNWLKYSALHYITSNPDWRRRQAALADKHTSPEAIMELLNSNWVAALRDSNSREAFAEQIECIDTLRLQELIADRLDSTGEQKVSINTKQPRVAIYTPQITNATHGGTLLTLNIASSLNKAGVDYRIFTSQETDIPCVVAYTGSMDICRIEKIELASIKLQDGGDCQLYLPNIGMSLFSRYQDLSRVIDNYSPDIILFVGFMSPLIHALYKKYPVLGLSIHTSCPAVPMDLWLSNQPVEDGSRWQVTGSASVAHFPYRFWRKGNAIPISRNALKIPEQAVLLVTAGFRLSAEIRPPWNINMLEFLDAHKNVYWLLLGVNEQQIKYLRASHDRLRILGPQNNPEIYYASSDIYVDTPSIGGGGAVAMAMEQGTPAIAFTGTDGGNKTGKFAVASNEDYFKLLDAWVNDAAARNHAGNEQKLMFDTRLDFSSENAQHDIQQAINQTIELCNQRLEATVE